MTRLFSYSTAEGSSFGILSADGGGVIDLAKRLPTIGNMNELLIQQKLELARTFVDEKPDLSVAEVTFDRLLPAPGKIFCIGVNYGGRSAEYTDKVRRSVPIGLYPIRRLVYRPRKTASEATRKPTT